MSLLRACTVSSLLLRSQTIPLGVRELQQALKLARLLAQAREGARLAREEHPRRCKFDDLALVQDEDLVLW